MWHKSRSVPLFNLDCADSYTKYTFATCGHICRATVHRGNKSHQQRTFADSIGEETFSTDNAERVSLSVFSLPSSLFLRHLCRLCENKITSSSIVSGDVHMNENILH